MSTMLNDIDNPDVVAAAENSWDKVKNARKENRPQTRDYLDKLFTGVFEVKGDRCYGDDASIVTAIAWFETGRSR